MIVGLAGLAGSGKDTVADFLVKDHGFVKVAFADPLKRICEDVYDFTDEQLWGPSSKRNEPDKRYVRSRFPGHASNTVDGELRCLQCGTPTRYENGAIAQEWLEEECVVYLTPRHALQQLGSEWGRECYADTWVDYAIRTADKLLTDEDALYTPQAGLFSYYEHHGQYSIGKDKRPPINGVVISDVRFLNELDALREWGGGFGGKGKVMKVLRGKGLTGAAGAHRSEQELTTISDEAFDVLIDNRETSLEQLREQVSAIVKNRLHL